MKEETEEVEEGVVSEVYKTPVAKEEFIEEATKEFVMDEAAVTEDAVETAEENLDDLFGEVSMDMTEEEQKRILAEFGDNETTEG